LIFYFQEKKDKESYVYHMKIKRLIKEQREILETLPDGLIIHQNKGGKADVKYLN
jgi:predicted Zn-dependent protease